MTVTSADVHRMTETLYIDGPLRGRMSSKFWILLLLASVIATAGVIADSTATVIGAMIVAPLMTPILGTALAVVLADREHVVRSVLLVLGGALVVIAIGLHLGLPGCAPGRVRDERPGDLPHPPQAHRPHRGAGDRDWWAPSRSFGPTSPTRSRVSPSPSRWCPRWRWSACCSPCSATRTRRAQPCCSAPTWRPSSRPEPPCSSATAFVRSRSRAVIPSGTCVAARWSSSRASSRSWPSRSPRAASRSPWTSCSRRRPARSRRRGPARTDGWSRR